MAAQASKSDLIAQKYGLSQEWEEFKKETAGSVDEEGFSYTPSVWPFLERKGIILSREDLSPRHDDLEDIFDEAKIVDQTVHGILLEYEGKFYIFHIAFAGMYPFAHPFLCGQERYRKRKCFPLALDEEAAREKWAIWKECEEVARSRDLSLETFFDSILFEKGYWPKREWPAPLMDEERALALTRLRSA